MDPADSESSLVAQAVGGDMVALERLLLSYASRLQARLAKKLPLSLRSVVAADDVLQDAFVEAFRGIGSFQPAGRFAFYRWLSTIAEHRLQDAIKAHRAAKRGGGRAKLEAARNPWCDSLDDLLELLGGSKSTPSRSAARHEAAIAVQVGLASLKEDYRQVIELRHLQGLPVAETAQLMGRTPDAVRNLCRRGLEELHAVLGRSSDYLTRR
ncbi:MAG: sigma-70 family RNA polymerase sigma factor [Planctomycetes bacterium]|nr:sigma-70 family RNA polymerase sigma factor [Planctomycetota bacterium]